MKPIHYTEEAIKKAAKAYAKKAYEDMMTTLSKESVACHNSKVPSMVVPDGAELPAVTFSKTAWAKAQALVQLCDKEVAWHGLVDRDGMEFTITDVYVPPQQVTGTSVESDSNEWALWSTQFSNDEFNHLRCHMHSHVNMSVFSSGVDDDYQKDMVLKNGNLDYYIFLIFNKKGEVFARVYDVENNIMYDNTEVSVFVPEDDEIDWAREQLKTQVKAKTWTKPTTNWKGRTSYYQNLQAEVEAEDDEDETIYYGGRQMTLDEYCGLMK